MIIRRLALLLCSVERLHHNFITLFNTVTLGVTKNVDSISQISSLCITPNSLLRVTSFFQVHISSGKFYIPSIVHNSCFRPKEDIAFQIRT
jgi:hypothetical protein